jgi:hypothetical protein
MYPRSTPEAHSRKMAQVLSVSAVEVCTYSRRGCGSKPVFSVKTLVAHLSQRET